MPTPTNWGLDPNRPRYMIGYPKMDFSYWDYKDVWSCCFYYDNPLKKHTWFFRIAPEFAKSEIPNWSIHQWMRFGSDSIILPQQIYNLFIQYKNWHPHLKDKRVSQGLDLFKFFINYGLLWIWAWKFGSRYQENFNFGLPSLIRKFYCKWWTKWSIEDSVTLIKSDLNFFKDIYHKEQDNKIKKDEDHIQDPLLLL